MKKKMKTVVKKTAKIAGVTCLALGSAALIASGAALKALTEGAAYLKDAVKKIVRDESGVDASAPEAAEVVEETVEEIVEVVPVVEEEAAASAEAEA